MSSKPLLIHIGYHKTATTWLQSRVFKPRHGFHEVLDHAAVFDAIIAPHPLDFDPAPVRDRLAAARAAAPGDGVDVVSLEALSGLPYDGGRESALYAERLHRIAPEARILVTIREQVAVMASLYMQYLSRAGTQSPARFFDERPYPGYTKFSHRHFYYDRLVARYQALFGPDNVFVLPLETVAADQCTSVGLLAAFSGNDRLDPAAWAETRTRNVSYPQFAAPLLRRANHFRSDALNPNPPIDLGAWPYRAIGGLARRLPLPAAIARARPVTEHLRRQHAGAFTESNRCLQDLLPHPVDLPGYQGVAESDRRDSQDTAA